jgi:hypothetical protein
MMDIVLMRSRPHRTSSSSGVFRPLQVKASKPRRCAAKGIEVARVEIAKDGKIIAMIGNEQCEFAYCLTYYMIMSYNKNGAPG